MKTKLAQVIAESLCVICPHCGEAQPNPDDGSEQWSSDQLKKYKGKKACCACDEQIIVHWTSKAMVQ